MNGEQGKHFGWFKIKREILLAIINGENTRPKLKDIFSSRDRKDRVSNKDIDYHLKGTDEKPGLIRRGIVLEERGILRLNLTNVRHLVEIMGYLLGDDAYRRALDIEFSACYLDYHGDRLASLHDPSDEERTSLKYYEDWISGFYPDEEKIEPDGFIKLALKGSQEWRGGLTNEDRIRYIVAYYSLVARLPKIDEDVSLYRVGSVWDTTLAWRNLDKIWEMADRASTEEITKVMQRFVLLSKGKMDYRTFPRFQVEDLGLPNVIGVVTRALYESLDRLSFEEEIHTYLHGAGYAYSYGCEIIKILRGEKWISLKELDRLGKILKAFNESQNRIEVRRSFTDTEEKLREYYGERVA
ncbi:MAG: hypothetical protein AAE986_00830 [Thermoplasmataceae archaeon]